MTVDPGNLYLNNSSIVHFLLLTANNKISEKHISFPFIYRKYDTLKVVFASVSISSIKITNFLI